MEKISLFFIVFIMHSFSFGQNYSTTLDTFYVQTPEYSNSIAVDSLAFPCAITIPDNGSNFPLVILVHGTSALDKDANSTKDFLDSLGANYRKAATRMFYEIADFLSSNGIMVLRYDKRSFILNCIEKPACWFVDTISPYDYISDIHSAINFAKTLPNIDSCNIFLAGHSQGGSFVSQVAYQRSDIRGVLNMAGTAQPIDSVSIYQRATIDQDLLGANILRKQFDSLRIRLWPMSDTLYMTHFSPRFWLDWISHTDSALIVQQESDKATAFMYGTADRFVPPNIHLQIWEDAVIRPNITFQLFNDIDHSFGTEFDSTMSLTVLNFMNDWIHDNTEICGITKLEENYHNKDYSVFPNPTNEKIYIESFEDHDASYQIYTIDGKEIMKGVISGNNTIDIDMSILSNALYFVRIETSVFKIIKE